MKVYSIKCSFEDRRTGPGTGRSLTIQASRPDVALAKAAKRFWTRLNRRERFDAKRSLKLEITAVHNSIHWQAEQIAAQSEVGA